MAMNKITVIRALALSACGSFWFFCHMAYAAGDRREVKRPDPIQPVCVTLYPSRNLDSVATQAEIQQALNHCPTGQAVQLSHDAAGHIFTSGPLHIPSGVFLRLDQGTVLAADPNPEYYDKGQGLCGTIDKKGKGCRPFIQIKNSQGGGIQGAGTIDGQGGVPMSGQAETWWEMARRAQSIPGGRQNAPRLIQVDNARDITIQGIRLHNSPNFHIVLNHVNGGTVWGVVIDTPASARNTDGIDPGASQDITIAESFIRTGDDNIAIKAGNGPTEHISITGNHFYSGHGMSIGSEVNAGVRDVVVHDLTLDGTTSGLRIKSDVSRGGLVSDIEYAHICMRNNRWPVTFDTHYSSTAKGDAVPVYQNIVLRDVHSTNHQPGTVLLRGYDASHPVDVMMDGVTFSPDTRWHTEFLHLTQGGQGVWPAPPGIAPTPMPQHLQTDCSGKWLPFPEVTLTQ